MTFIVPKTTRKPKFIAQFMISSKRENVSSFSLSREGITSYGKSEAVRKYIKGEIDFRTMKKNIPSLDKETVKALEELALSFKIKKSLNNIDVYFTSSIEAKRMEKVNVYFISAKNINSNKTKQAFSDFNSDKIVLNDKAWFESEEVYSASHKAFFNIKTGKINIAIHPKDIEDLEKSKDMHPINVEGISITNGVVSIDAKSVIIFDLKDRIENDISEKNKTRIVVELKKSKVKNSIPVSVFEGDRKVSRHLAFIDFNVEGVNIAELADGKYNIYDKSENKERWLVINTTKSFLENVREIMVMDKGHFEKELSKVKEIDLFA